VDLDLRTVNIVQKYVATVLGVRIVFHFGYIATAHLLSTQIEPVVLFVALNILL